MNSPLVSVILPVYNAEPVVAAAVTSILEQSYSNLELIIVDDASSDNSYAILQSYAKLDSRIKLYRNSYNLRLPQTLNLAISKASGKYVARMDADDIALTERIASQVQFMEANPDIGVCGTWYRAFKDEIKNTVFITRYPTEHESIKINLKLLCCALGHPTVMIRKQIMEPYAINMENSAEDYELWLRLLDHGVKFANLPQVLLLYRLSDAQLSQVNSSALSAWQQTVITKGLRDLFRSDYSAAILHDYIKLLLEPKRISFIWQWPKYINLLRQLQYYNRQHQIFAEQEFAEFIDSLSIFRKIFEKLRRWLLGHAPWLINLK